jgi:hypothetical protein
VLREYGLVDRFGLTSAMGGEKLPSKDDVVDLLKSGSCPLPPSISASHLADAILSDLREQQATSAVAPLRVPCKLDTIPAGTQAAGRYHRHIFALLKFIFEGSLCRGSIEKEINRGRKRVDIVFDNTAQSGFFYELGATHRVFCPKIFVECKNYTNDLRNPEFDQLVGRFHKRRGNFGILICRRIKDKQKALATSQDFLNGDRGWVLFLEDGDIKSLLRFRAADDAQGVDDFMAEKLDSLVMA